MSNKTTGRSREGAWIEMSPLGTLLNTLLVAPARERGLKFPNLSAAL